jgi:hypothetical protein
MPTTSTLTRNTPALPDHHPSRPPRASPSSCVRRRRHHHRDATAKRSRVEQPFGALLVTPAAIGRRAVDYRRVAADSMVTVQFQENVSLTNLLDNVRTIDVL